MRNLGLALIAVGLAASLTVAIAQIPQPNPNTPTEPNRFTGGAEGYLKCIDIVHKAKQPMQMACYVTGTMSRFGDITARSATCDNAAYNEEVKACFNGFAAKGAYLGSEGPVCGALLFDVRPSGDKPPNQYLRTVHSKETFPCEGSPMPPIAANDKGEVKSMVWPRHVEQSSKSACVFKDKKVANVKGTCIARGAPDKSGKITLATQATCSDPALADFALSCLSSLRLNKFGKESPPAQVCVRISHTGKDLTDGHDPSTGAAELETCPEGFFN